jgi:menaquinone-dependent protoporphyrinogen oxidase
MDRPSKPCWSRRWSRPRTGEHRLFAGKLDKTKLNWSERIAVRCAHAREGDHRDWRAIDEWRP